MTYPCRTLFACWLIVIATGTVVSHRHERAPGHAQGCGWASMEAPEDAAGSSGAHRHFVLLGIESGAIPEGAETGGTNETGRVEPAAELLAPVDGDPDVPAVDLSLPALAAISLPPTVDVSCADAPSALQFQSLAAHVRSTVLRL